MSVTFSGQSQISAITSALSQLDSTLSTNYPDGYASANTASGLTTPTENIADEVSAYASAVNELLNNEVTNVVMSTAKTGAIGGMLGQEIADQIVDGRSAVFTAADESAQLAGVPTLITSEQSSWAPGRSFEDDEACGAAINAAMAALLVLVQAVTTGATGPAAEAISAVDTLSDRCISYAQAFSVLSTVGSKANYVSKVAAVGTAGTVLHNTYLAYSDGMDASLTGNDLLVAMKSSVATTYDTLSDQASAVLVGLADAAAGFA